MACLHWAGRMDSAFLLFLPKDQGSQFCQLEMGVGNQCQTPELSFTVRLEHSLRLGGSPACVPLAMLLLIQTRMLLATWTHAGSCTATVSQLP